MKTYTEIEHLKIVLELTERLAEETKQKRILAQKHNELLKSYTKTLEWIKDNTIVK